MRKRENYLPYMDNLKLAIKSESFDKYYIKKEKPLFTVKDIRKRMFEKYCSSQNYFFSQDINEFLKGTKTYRTIRINEFIILDENKEWLKMYFPKIYCKEFLKRFTKANGKNCESPLTFYNLNDRIKKSLALKSKKNKETKEENGVNINFLQDLSFYPDMIDTDSLILSNYNLIESKSLETLMQINNYLVTSKKGKELNNICRLEGNSNFQKIIVKKINNAPLNELRIPNQINLDAISNLKRFIESQKKTSKANKLQTERAKPISHSNLKFQKKEEPIKLKSDLYYKLQTKNSFETKKNEKMKYGPKIRSNTTISERIKNFKDGSKHSSKSKSKSQRKKSDELKMKKFSLNSLIKPLKNVSKLRDRLISLDRNPSCISDYLNFSKFQLKSKKEGTLITDRSTRNKSNINLLSEKSSDRRIEEKKIFARKLASKINYNNSNEFIENFICGKNTSTENPKNSSTISNSSRLKSKNDENLKLKIESKNISELKKSFSSYIKAFTERRK